MFRTATMARAATLVRARGVIGWSAVAGAGILLGLAGCSGGSTGPDSSSVPTPPTATTSAASPSTGPASPSGSARGSSSTRASNSPTATGSTKDLTQEKFQVSWKDAVAKAKHSFDGQLSEVGMDAERPSGVYKVELVSSTEEFKVYVDGHSGKLTRPHTEKLDADDRQEKLKEVVDPGQVVSWRNAMSTALDKHSGPVVEWKLEGTDRGPQYQFDIGTGDQDREVSVDAKTGKIRHDD